MKRLCTCLISMAISRKSGNQSKLYCTCAIMYSVQQYLYNLCVRNGRKGDNAVNLYRISVESCQFPSLFL